ncbi:uncharacterized protein STEHIDRAFT_115652 [Stereum hirsutum FP-91666 SS1]|uniref:uncharacterized protein n=1 Tax=Stereum hirsutum (strain FP-91666) TaxID=721885 RepID=UPI0004449233|nr:uncharacterized protein STEHIDRAFT_115652 [Stereum hirsutum FP-91666 SS1]EIM80808.1 hypothetical protein STEHIDRAFT_115652 [Stereum hirsutum FP-91666 SS1]
MHALHLLGRALCSRAVVSGNISDLDEGLEFLHAALVVATSLSNNLILLDIAGALHARWDLTGILDDLQTSINTRRLITTHMYTGTPLRVQITIIRDLSTALFLRFTHFPRLVDLHESIALIEQALTLSTGLNDQAEMFEDLCTLAQTLLVRWDYDGDMSGVERATSLYRKAVTIAPSLAQPLDHALALNALSEAIQGKLFLPIEDLEECIALDHQALTMVPKDNPERALTLAAMATTTLVRFTLEEREQDWECYQNMHRELASIIATSKAIPLVDDSSWAAFQHVGQYAGRHALTSIFRQSHYIRRAEQDWTAMPVEMRNLGPDLFLRRLVDPTGTVEQFLVNSRILLRAIPNDPGNQRLRMYHISRVAWRCRSKVLSEPWDPSPQFPRAVHDVEKKWLDHAPLNHPWLFAYYYGLADDLFKLYCNYIDAEREDEALEVLREIPKNFEKAVELQTLICHPYAYKSMADLANAYIWLGETDPSTPRHTIDQAIKYGELAVQNCPAGYANEVRVYADAYLVRYALWNDQSDIDTAMQIFKRGSEDQRESLTERYNLADRWADAAEEHDHGCRLDAYISRVNLLIARLSEGFNMARLTTTIDLLGGPAVISSAIEFCLDRGALDDALYILGRGRGVLWARLVELQRRNVQLLRRSKPNEVEKLNMMLEAAEMERQIESAPRSSKVTSIELWSKPVIPWLNSSAREDRLLVVIRALAADAVRQSRLGTGYDTSNDTRAWKSFVDSVPVNSFPVVVLNAASRRCDALIVRSQTSIVEHVSLPQCNRSQLDALVNRTGTLLEAAGISVRQASEIQRGTRPWKRTQDSFEAVLAEVWRIIVAPILNALDLKVSDTPPRLWWYPTGPFWQIPVHAAGIYSGPEQISVQDFVISSYLPAFNMSHRIPEPKKHTNILAVYQTHTPGFPSLPGTSVEAKAIESITAMSRPEILFTEIGDSNTTLASVVNGLPAANIVHFALHGRQDDTNPLDSHLLLNEHETLKLSQLMEMDLPNADLVFLSACETATGHKVVPEEVIHLAAAMLFVGFKGAIGTMWSISDSDGPIVAEKTYQVLLEKPEFDPRDAARALHMAVKTLRRLKVPPLRWVPFIHIGL